jgi:hypothetical protein
MKHRLLVHGGATPTQHRHTHTHSESPRERDRERENAPHAAAARRLGRRRPTAPPPSVTGGVPAGRRRTRRAPRGPERGASHAASRAAGGARARAALSLDGGQRRGRRGSGGGAPAVGSHQQGARERVMPLPFSCIHSVRFPLSRGDLVWAAMLALELIV